MTSPHKPTLGLDISALNPLFKEHAQRGIGRYVRELCAALEKIEFGKFDVHPIDLSGGGKLTWIDRCVQRLPVGRGTVGRQVVTPLKLAFGQTRGMDALHFPAHMDVPAWNLKRNAVTVLDLIPLVLSDLYKSTTPGWRFQCARFFENTAIRRADLIFAISECTASDVNRILGVPRERIIVTPLGVGESFFSATRPADEGAVRHKLGIPQQVPILLYVGGIDQRKNVSTLIEAFAEVRKRMSKKKGAHSPVLVLSGSIQRDKEYPKLVQQIEAMQLAPFVIRPGFVADVDLLALFKISSAFVFASLYEGFGLPPLEAMAAGVPVISSKASCLEEVLGDAAWGCNPLHTKDFIDGMMAVLTKPEIAKKLAEQGPKQASKFTWERTARTTLAGYERLLKVTTVTEG